jgi:hypothetical protein
MGFYLFYSFYKTNSHLCNRLSFFALSAISKRNRLFLKKNNRLKTSASCKLLEYKKSSGLKSLIILEDLILNQKIQRHTKSNIFLLIWTQLIYLISTVAVTKVHSEIKWCWNKESSKSKNTPSVTRFNAITTNSKAANISDTLINNKALASTLTSKSDSSMNASKSNSNMSAGTPNDTPNDTITLRPSMNRTLITLIQLPIVLIIFLFLCFSTKQTLAQYNFQDYCLAANVDRYLWITNSLQNYEKKPLNTRYQQAEEIFRKNREPLSMLRGPWENGLVPTLQAQKAAIEDAIEILYSPKIQNLNQARSFLKGQIPSGGSDYMKFTRLLIQSFNSDPDPDSKKLLEKRPISKILEEPQNPDFLRDIQNSAQITVVCSKLSFTNSLQCLKAVQEILKESRWSGANLLFPQIWLEAFEVKTFQDGLRLLALKQISRLEKEFHTPGSSRFGNIIDDAFAAFTEAKMPPSQIESYVWKTLALYGNGGHNTGSRTLFYDLSEKDMITTVSLSIIGTATSFLDFSQKIKGGPHYALPQTIQGHCLNPKPYHFWMNAFISYNLVQKGFSPEIAAISSFTLSKGYHLNRHLNNVASDIERVFNKKALHPTHQVIKMDLVLNAAGSLYGANQLKKDSNFSEALHELIEKTKSSRPLNSKQTALLRHNKIRLLNHWHYTFQPNFVFHLLRNNPEYTDLSQKIELIPQRENSFIESDPEVFTEIEDSECYEGSDNFDDSEISGDSNFHQNDQNDQNDQSDQSNQSNQSDQTSEKTEIYEDFQKSNSLDKSSDSLDEKKIPPT